MAKPAAAAKGWPLVEYLALIPLLTAVSVAVTLASGPVIDRFGTRRAMQTFPVPWVFGFAILSFLSNLGAAAVAFVILGAAHGLQATLITAFWAEFFGTRHIGAIKAVSTSVMVFGSAIGPGVSGVLIDAGLDFPAQMLWIAAFFAVAAALVYFAVEQAFTRLPRLPKVDVERA